MLTNDAQDILGGTGSTSQQMMPPPNRKQQALPNANLTNVDKKVQLILIINSILNQLR